MLKVFLKYAIISAAALAIVVVLRFIPYVKPVQDWLPLSNEAFNSLGVNQPPTTDLDQTFLPAEKLGFPNRLFGGSDFAGSNLSPSKDFEPIDADKVTPLPFPKPVPVPETAPQLSQITVPTAQEAVQAVQKVIERIIIREVPVYVPQPAPTPAPVPAPVVESLSSVCSIQTFENSAGGISHTLLYRCEGFNECSIAKNGESFIDVDGKGYFNFPGSPPSNYKIRCDDVSRVWLSAITPNASKPLYDQAGFRWFKNDDVEVGGAPLAGINQPVNFSKTGNSPIRLRLAVLSARVDVAKNDAKFKIQAAFTIPAVPVNASNPNTAVICNKIADNEFKDLEKVDNLVFVDNPSLADKSLMAPSISDPFYGVAIPETYQESNSISNTNAAIPKDAPGIWDIAFRFRSMDSNQLACFRFVRGDSSPLDAYDVWPAVYNN